MRLKKHDLIRQGQELLMLFHKIKDKFRPKIRNGRAKERERRYCDMLRILM